MNLGDRDLFEVWRLALALVCGIYATVVTLRSLWGWLVYFMAPDRTTQLMKSYVVVQLLRLRWSRFTKEWVAIGFYSVCIVFLLYWHD
ncbi:MAG: hypothetical protein MI923_05995 [Phycisphaerales bacterium]|nr:hypothetical protein [Phycisphaerales bacterium]